MKSGNNKIILKINLVFFFFIKGVLRNEEASKFEENFEEALKNVNSIIVPSKVNISEWNIKLF